VGKGLRGRTPALTCAAKADGKRTVVAEVADAHVARVVCVLRVVCVYLRVAECRLFDTGFLCFTFTKVAVPAKYVPRRKSNITCSYLV
jgi:hypothetical protein